MPSGTKKTNLCLLIDDRKDHAERLSQIVSGIPRANYRVDCISVLDDGFPELRSGRYAVCLIDEDMPNASDLDRLAEIRDSGVDTPVILVNKTDEQVWQREIMPRGVSDIISMKELSVPFLVRAIRNAQNELRRYKADADQQREVTSLTATLRLRTQLMRLALDNAKHGIAMFDGAGHLTTCNAKYREIYGFSAEVVRPGISIREILEYSISLGNYTDEDAGRLLSERVRQSKSSEPSTYEQHLRDGRIIAVSHQPIPDGRSVSTCEDITETVRLIRAAQDCEQQKARNGADDSADMATLESMSRDVEETLKAITTIAEAMRDEILGPLGDAYYKTYAKAILNSAGRLLATVEETRRSCADADAQMQPCAESLRLKQAG